MSTLRYTGAYASQDGHQWAVHIDVVTDNGSDAITTAPRPLTFGDEPVTLEWPERERYQALEGASCVVHIISEGDRDFTSLYTEGVGGVRMSLYRDDTLFWHGTLDPEFYEEPYERAAMYEVALTFSDLGALERLNFRPAKTARLTIHQILTHLLQSAGLRTNYLSRFTLGRYAGPNEPADPLTLSDIAISGANFYDEDGEPLNAKDALEGLLVPLGLKLRQAGGRLTVYDLATLRADSAPVLIRWTTNAQTLGTGAVYNEFTLTYSPYGDAQVIEGAMDNAAFPAAPAADTYKYWGDTSKTWDAFTVGLIRSAPQGCPLTIDGPARYGKFTKIYSGSDETVIVGGIRSTDPASTAPLAVDLTFKNAGHRGSNGKYDNITTLFTAPARWLRGRDDGDTGTGLRITLDLLLDCRYNPFEPAATQNEEGDYKRQTKNWNFVYLPLMIWLTGDNGQTYHWYNEGAIGTFGDWQPVNSSRLALWRQGQPAWGDCWLAYYDWQDRRSKSACTGWATNRPIAGGATVVPQWWQKRGDGEFIDRPPVSGTLHIAVGSGVMPLGHDGRYYDTDKVSGVPLQFAQPRWLCYREPRVVLVDAYGNEQDRTDIIYRATLNPAAADPLELETVCGSAHRAPATARGQYFLDTQPMGKVVRGPLHDYPEYILLATLASQYDVRRVRLAGECAQGADTALHAYTDAAQPATMRLLRTAARLDTRAGMGECTFIELSDPKYTPVTEL